MTEKDKLKIRKLDLTKEADVQWLTDELMLTDTSGAIVEIFKMCIIMDARSQIQKAIIAGNKYMEINVNTEAVLKNLSMQLRGIRGSLQEKVDAYDNLIQQIEEGV